MRRAGVVTAIAFGTFVFLGIAFLLARGLTGAGAERGSVLEVLRAQARGDAAAVLGRLPACRREAACARGHARAGGEAAPRRARGDPHLPPQRAALAHAPGRARARVAWRAGTGRPVVQCVRVRREGPLTGGGRRAAGRVGPDRARRRLLTARDFAAGLPVAAGSADLPPRPVLTIALMPLPLPARRRAACSSPRRGARGAAAVGADAVRRRPRRAASCSTGRGCSGSTRRTPASRTGCRRPAAHGGLGARRRSRTPGTRATTARPRWRGGDRLVPRDFELPDADEALQLGRALRVRQLPRDRVAQRPRDRHQHRRLPALRARLEGARAGAARTGWSSGSTRAASDRTSRPTGRRRPACPRAAGGTTAASSGRSTCAGSTRPTSSR